jgi:regulator of cell morphogenesis and NO signaling
MKKEEMVLFPKIRQIASLHREHMVLKGEDKDFLLAPVAVMETEHALAGDLMEEIQSITNQFKPPADACMTFRITYHELKEFAADLHLHVHLENNLLFPKALGLFEPLGPTQLN